MSATTFIHFFISGIPEHSHPNDHFQPLTDDHPMTREMAMEGWTLEILI